MNVQEIAMPDVTGRPAQSPSGVPVSIPRMDDLSLSLRRPANQQAAYQVRGILTLAFGCALVLAAASAAIVYLASDLELSRQKALWICSALGAGAGVTLTVGVSVAQFIRSRHEKRRQNFAPVSPVLGGSLDQQLMATERSIGQYQQLALEQARIAFAQSQGAMVAVLASLIVGAGLVGAVSSRQGQFLISGFTLLASAFSAFLAKTFLDVFRQSIYQLNHSHSIPITKNLAILANTLAVSRDIPEGREPMVADVVAALLAALAEVGLVTGAPQAGTGQRNGRRFTAEATDAESSAAMNSTEGSRIASQKGNLRDGALSRVGRGAETHSAGADG